MLGSLDRERARNTAGDGRNTDQAKCNAIAEFLIEGTVLLDSGYQSSGQFNLGLRETDIVSQSEKNRRDNGPLRFGGASTGSRAAYFSFIDFFWIART